MDPPSQNDASGEGKGKQKAAPPNEPATDAPASPPRNSAHLGSSSNSQPSGASGSHSAEKNVILFADWTARRSASVSQHEDMRAANGQERQDGTSEPMQPEAPAGCTPEAPVHGPLTQVKHISISEVFLAKCLFTRFLVQHHLHRPWQGTPAE